MRHATTDQIIATALEAAMHPERWTGVLDLLATLVPGGRVHLMRYWNDGRGIIDGQSRNYDPDFSDSYFSHYHTINPRIPALHKVPQGLATANHVNMPFDVLRRSEFYNDWMRPQEDCHRGGGLLVSCWPTVAVYVGADIPSDLAEDAEPDFVATLDRLAPFLAHTARVNDTLFANRLDCLAAPLGPGPAWFMLGTDARLALANPEGQALLAEGALVRIDALGRLRLGPALAATTPLADLIAARRCLRLRLGQACGAGAETEISVTPLPDGMLHPDGHHPLSRQIDRLSLLVVARRPALQDPDMALAHALGLTPAEAAVARRLAAGQTIAEIAHDRDRSEVTIRNQIKSACQKLGVRGQSGLIRSALTAREEPDRAP